MAIADLLKAVNPEAGKVLKELAENEIAFAGRKATFGKRKFMPENVLSTAANDPELLTAQLRKSVTFNEQSNSVHAAQFIEGRRDAGGLLATSCAYIHPEANGIELPVLVDSGSEINWIRADVAEAIGISWVSANLQVSGVTGSSPVEGIAKDVKVTVEGVTRPIAFYVQRDAPLRVLLGTPLEHTFETTASADATGNRVLKIRDRLGNLIVVPVGTSDETRNAGCKDLEQKKGQILNHVNLVKISKELSTRVEADDEIIQSPIVLVEQGSLPEGACSGITHSFESECALEENFCCRTLRKTVANKVRPANVPIPGGEEP
jgi:hypothetical protein